MECLVPLFLIQWSAHAHWEAADNGSNTWDPATHMGNSDGVQAHGLSQGPAPAVMGIWEVPYKMEDVSFSFSLK